MQNAQRKANNFPMPSWKCDSFEAKSESKQYWDGFTTPVENCGLCKNWNRNKCKFHNELKELGENAEVFNNDFGFDHINVEYEWSSYGK